MSGKAREGGYRFVPLLLIAAGTALLVDSAFRNTTWIPGALAVFSGGLALIVPPGLFDAIGARPTVAKASAWLMFVAMAIGGVFAAVYAWHRDSVFLFGLALVISGSAVFVLIAGLFYRRKRPLDI